MNPWKDTKIKLEMNFSSGMGHNGPNLDWTGGHEGGRVVVVVLVVAVVVVNNGNAFASASNSNSFSQTAI
jgi:hypothetical protein